MPTRPIERTISKRATHDSEFRAALVAEALKCLCENDVATAKSILRTYVMTAIGFEELGRRMGERPESLIRMMSDKGNPSLSKLAALLSAIKTHDGVNIEVRGTL
ncbi:helix-turn-helix domain-containing transcriptional regulator [Botrimarina colliarenosi]|nr:transcriptional regulator [Botrimarina colliarenosi]